MASVPTVNLPGSPMQCPTRARARPGSDLDWLVPMTIAAATQIALWWFAWRMGLARPPLFQVYGILGCTVLVSGGLAVFLFRLIQMMRRRERSPLARSAQWLRENAPRIFMAVLAVQISSAAAAAFAALKSALPSVTPFWLDHGLASAELRLVGIHPWELSHWLFGWATPAVDLVYFSWIFAQMLAFYAILVLKPSPLKTRALVSYSYAWLILGVGGAYLLSSAGPIFYDRIFGGSEFAGLHAALRDAPMAQHAASKLWEAYSLRQIGVASGISAMPSLHVALALWLALILKGSRAAILGWLYFALICLGSVHLGWHYASDGVVGAIGFGLIWRASAACVRSSPMPASEQVATDADSVRS